MTERVLVVDDDAPIRRMLERVLAAEGYDVETVPDGGTALAAVEAVMPDVVVLDVAMDGVDGLAVCRRIRRKGLAVPILLLTARIEPGHPVARLVAGADDYVVKPFDTDELLARIRALLRRGRPPEATLAHGDVALDRAARRVRRGSEEVQLSAREAELLALLLRNARRVVTRDQVISEVWQGGATPNAVDRLVSNLRRKLGDPDPIETIRGAGFTLR